MLSDPTGGIPSRRRSPLTFVSKYLQPADFAFSRLPSEPHRSSAGGVGWPPGSLTEAEGHLRCVRSSPNSRHHSARLPRPFSANSGLERTCADAPMDVSSPTEPQERVAIPHLDPCIAPARLSDRSESSLKILWHRKPVHLNDRAPRLPPAYGSAIEVSAKWPSYAPSRLTLSSPL